MQPQTAELTPTQFADSLALRAKELRFRGVGNQFAFLDGIGIIPIKEFLYRGANIIDLAETLNLPITVVNRWIEQHNYQSEIEEASQLSAEGYIYQGERLLKAAQNKFELDKAKAMLEHGRFMASKKDKGKYGNNNEMAPMGAGVTYIFHVGEQKEAMPAIDAEYEVKQPEEEPKKDVTLSLDFKLPDPPEHIDNSNVTNIKPVELAQDSEATADAEQADRSRPAEQDRWNY